MNTHPSAPPDQPPPYHQIGGSSVIHTTNQGPPIIQHPPITIQPIVQQQQQQVISTIQVVHTGNQCGCRHNFRSEYTCCGVCCAIFCFPCGIIWCCCTRKQRCRHCNLYA